MADEETTPVVFRVWNDLGTVIALFPTLPADVGGNECDSYECIGQHGPADYESVVRRSRPATPEEYAPLKAELEGAPYFYRLSVMLRAPKGAWVERQRRATEGRHQ